MTARTACITGAASGIGLEVARLLAADQWRLLLVVRPGRAGAPELADLRSLSPGVDVVEADLSSASGAAHAAAEVARRAPQLDALVNNAGVMTPQAHFNADGIEQHMAVNVLTPFVMMQALRPHLAAARPAVVVNVSSTAALQAGPLNVEVLARPAAFRPVYPYAQSKLAISLMTRSLAADYARDGVHLVSVNPGPNRTKMSMGPGMPEALAKTAAESFPGPEIGAGRIVRGLTMALSGQVNGAYLMNDEVADLQRDEQEPELLAFLMQASRS